MSGSDSLERFRATVTHTPHDRPLFGFGCTPDLDRRLRERLRLAPGDSIEEALGLPRRADAGLRPPEGFTPPDFTPYFRDFEIPPRGWINGIGVLEIPGSLYHFTRYVSPLRNAATLREVESFPFPSCDNWTGDHIPGEVERAHERGEYVVAWVGHIYEDAWQIRGYEPFLIDMVERPEIPGYILDRIVERNLRVAVEAARGGADCLCIGDDVANERSLMFSIDHWRRFMKPRWAKVIAAAREVKPDIEVDYHSDGNILALIPALIEIGVTILNPIQPECMDPVEVKRRFGDRIVLKGTVGTQTTMPFGTTAEVKRVVRERRRTLGRDGALILEPTHVLEPEVPIDNILAFVEACKE